MQVEAQLYVSQGSGRMCVRANYLKDVSSYEILERGQAPRVRQMGIISGTWTTVTHIRDDCQETNKKKLLTRGTLWIYLHR